MRRAGILSKEAELFAPELCIVHNTCKKYDLWKNCDLWKNSWFI